MRKHLKLDSAKTLAYALVASKLDYCNSLLYGVAGVDTDRLQRVQDTLARVVTRSGPFAHAPPLLKSLHWLPIKFRINFKVKIKTLQSEKPSYLHNILAKATCYMYT